MIYHIHDLRRSKAPPDDIGDEETTLTVVTTDGTDTEVTCGFRGETEVPSHVITEQSWYLLERYDVFPHQIDGEVLSIGIDRVVEILAVEQVRIVPLQDRQIGFVRVNGIVIAKPLGEQYIASTIGSYGPSRANQCKIVLGTAFENGTVEIAVVITSPNHIPIAAGIEQWCRIVIGFDDLLDLLARQGIDLIHQIITGD